MTAVAEKGGFKDQLDYFRNRKLYTSKRENKRFLVSNSLQMF